MGRILNEKNYINNNIFEYEKRLGSQYSVFLEGNPTFVTYYHINNVESMTDGGFHTVEEVLGKNSPVKFQEIKDFPLYGLENIQLSLGEEEEGLNTSYEGSGIILPNTIKPMPNDCFTISYLNKQFLFMITQFEYDTIKSQGFYKIDFYLRSVTKDRIEDLEEQTSEKYNCVFTNIGTEDKCLIKEDEYIKLEELDSIYSDIINKYKLLYYDKHYNSFIYKDENDNIVYDQYLNHFIDKSEIFRDDYTYNTIVLSNEDYHHTFDLEFDSSIYNSVLKRNINKIKESINYELHRIDNITSVFSYYGLDNVYSIRYKADGNSTYLPSELLIGIINNESMVGNNIHRFLIDYFNNNIHTIYEVPLNEFKEYEFTYKLLEYRLLPVVLFILRYYRKEVIKLEN